MIILIKMEMAWLGTLLGKEEELSIGLFSRLAQRSARRQRGFILGARKDCLREWAMGSCVKAV